MTREAAFIFDLLIIAACPGVRSLAVAAKLKVSPWINAPQKCTVTPDRVEIGTDRGLYDQRMGV